jgi:hypothetical protein
MGSVVMEAVSTEGSSHREPARILIHFGQRGRCGGATAGDVETVGNQRNQRSSDPMRGAIACKSGRPGTSVLTRSSATSIASYVATTSSAATRAIVSNAARRLRR